MLVHVGETTNRLNENERALTGQKVRKQRRPKYRTHNLFGPVKLVTCIYAYWWETTCLVLSLLRGVASSLQDLFFFSHSYITWQILIWCPHGM